MMVQQNMNDWSKNRLLQKKGKCLNKNHITKKWTINKKYAWNSAKSTKGARNTQNKATAAQQWIVANGSGDFIKMPGNQLRKNIRKHTWRLYMFK